MQNHVKKAVLNGNQNAKSETIEWDKNCTGLGVRARGARRSWIVQWRDAGKTRKKTLGRFEEITRSEARQLAVALLGASDEPDIRQPRANDCLEAVPICPERGRLPTRRALRQIPLPKNADRRAV